MTANISEDYATDVSGGLRTNGQGKAIIAGMISIMKETIGGGPQGATVTLASDTATIVNDACIFALDTEGAAAADDFKAITIGVSGDLRDGMVVGFYNVNSARVVTVKNVAGARRIFTKSGRDVILADTFTIFWAKYKLADDAWYQIFPDVSNMVDLLAGSMPLATVDIASSALVIDRALTYANSGSAMHIDALTAAKHVEGNLVGLCTANAGYVRTLYHNVGTDDKLDLIGAANIIMAVNTWYFFVKTIVSGHVIWKHVWTIYPKGVTVGASTAAGKIPIGDGLGGWIESGGTLAKGSIPVGTSGSAFGYLAVGANGTSPVADSAEATGIKWATPSGGGGGRVNNYRLSVSSSDPEPGDISVASTIYLKEYNGDALDIYNGSTWSSYTALSLSIAVPSTQYFRIYDVFANYNSGTPQLALTAWDSGGQTTKTITAATAANPCVITATAHGLSIGDKIGIRKGTGTGTGWTDTAMGLDQKEFYISAVTTNTITLEGCDTSALTFSTFTGSPTLYKIPSSRTTAIVRQNGTWCQSGTLTKRLLGTFKTNGAGTVDDHSAVARNLSNVDNQVDTSVLAVDTSSSWTSPNISLYGPRSGSLQRGLTRLEFVLATSRLVDLTNQDAGSSGNSGGALSADRVEPAALGSTGSLFALSSDGYNSGYIGTIFAVDKLTGTAGSHFVQKMAYCSSAIYYGETFATYPGARCRMAASFKR